MNPVRYLKLNIIIFILGLGLSGYLIFHHYSMLNGEMFKSFCSISQSFDCDRVNTSSFSEFLGIPVSTIALGYYLLSLILSIAAIQNAFIRREILVFQAASTAVGLLVTAIMAGVSFFVLKTFCIICCGMYLVNILATLFSFLGLKAFGTWKPFNLKKVLGYAASTLIVIIIAHGITRGALYHPIPFDDQEFLSTFRAQPVLQIDIDPESPKMGIVSGNPAIQIVEFADLQCPTCALAAKHVHRLLAMYGDKIQVIFHHFPLDQSCNSQVSGRFHVFACQAAKAAACSHKNGKFIPYYEKVFENQKDISPENLTKWAVELGIDKKQFESCINAPETTSKILRDIGLAKTLDIKGTPTFFINGKRLDSPILFEPQLKAILRELGIK